MTCLEDHQEGRMRAVRFIRYGGVEVLEVVEVDRPRPHAGEVLIRVKSAGINPGESKIRIGQFHDRWPASFPEGQGSDFAGIIHAVGTGVTEFSSGDEVLGYTNNRASHAEYVVVPINQIVRKPPTVSWDVAGALFVVGTSAYALAQAAHVSAADTVVVSAAAGGVGSLAAQWSLSLGANVIGLAAPANHEWLRERGITPVDYRHPSLAGAVMDAAQGQRVTAMLDTYGAAYVQLGLDLGIAPKRIATTADFSAGERGAVLVTHFAVATPAVLTELAENVAAGTLEIPISGVYSLDQVHEAYGELEKGHTRGKIVLQA